jgi:hypothetical protein
MQCFGSGFGSARILNLWSDPDMDPELEVLVPNLAPDPVLEYNLSNHQKI